MIRKIQTWFLLTTCFALALAPNVARCEGEKEFKTPTEALQALNTAVNSPDASKALTELLGKDSASLWSSGDPVQDKEAKERFLAGLKESKIILPGDDHHLILFVGNQDWPFPIPLLQKGNNWVWDLKVGTEEILNRRIGANEFDAIMAAQEYVQAQKEYSQKLGGGTALYAQKFLSDAGQKNGLYWQAQGGDESPIGPEVTKAKTEGYTREDGNQDNALLFHGYYFRILKEQGKNAAGGAKKYLNDGKMTGGFALIAYPAKYDDSGVMTFLVNQDGKVWQKNLGKDTLKTAANMNSYDPDSSWKPAVGAP